MIYETNYIIHYNKNHDKLGRFAKGTNIGMYSKSTAKKLNKIDKMAQKNKKDDKIAKKLERITDDIYKDGQAYRSDVYDKLDKLAEKEAAKEFVSREEFKSVRDDYIKARDNAMNILESTLGRIGERKIDNDYTSQRLGSKTWSKINDIMESEKFSYDFFIDRMDWYLKNIPKNADFAEWAGFLVEG